MHREVPIRWVAWLLLLPTALLTWTLFTTVVGLAVSAADRGVPAQIDARTAALMAREAGARALFLLFKPLGFWQDAPHQTAAPEGDRQKLPVLLVPGAQANRSCLTFLRTFLVQRGWDWVWPVNIATHDSTLADMAAQIAIHVETLRDRTGSMRIDVVGHGTGGLAAAWYVQHQGGDATVRRLVTLGTPWRGSKMAVFRRGRAAREIDFGAPVLDGLIPPAVPTVSVWSDEDPTIIPSRSAVPEGLQSVLIEGAGHTEMLASARVFRAVQAALSHPLPASAP